MHIGRPVHRSDTRQDPVFSSALGLYICLRTAKCVERDVKYHLLTYLLTYSILKTENVMQ